jgi:hypothetical protein
MTSTPARYSQLGEVQERLAGLEAIREILHEASKKLEQVGSDDSFEFFEDLDSLQARAMDLTESLAEEASTEFFEETQPERSN